MALVDNNNKPHNIGPFEVECGSMMNKKNGNLLGSDVAMVVSIDEESGIGTLHKVGNLKVMEDFYNLRTQKLIQSGYEDLAREWQLIQFNIKYEEFNFKPQGYELDIDEVCTFVNWLMNCSCQNLRDFLTSDLNTIKEKLKQLYSFGY